MTQLSPSKSTTKRIRKQLIKRVSCALQFLSKPHLSDSDVHEARKSLKKARASLRLLRPALRPSDYRKENDRLRDAAQPLGRVRDAKLLPDTLRLLAHHCRKPVNALQVKLKQDNARLAPRELAHSRRLLRKARTRLKHIKLEADNWKVVGPALHQVYRQGRRALAEAREQNTPEDFHEWRKQAKYLRYTLESLEPLRPPLIHTMADTAHDLTDCLGNDHDLTVLRQKTNNAEPLAALITRFQHELRRTALALGARLYEEKPGAFTHRFAGYWRQWRH